ncbi:3-keto-disaccharide hydrolase [Roseimarinus sediminis]|jgi:hypothetical protein|uniref:3-keto-disaccharide hydrolase n=1 Tax=Roseimarinus sediminis TaxID=1610899 RepID=UPI003D19EEB2
MKNRILFISSLVLAILASACAEKAGPNQLTKKEKADGWELLFDGSTMDLWRGYCMSDVPGAWEVEEGTIHINGSGRGEAGASDGGDIITRKEYQNFELALEWKVSEGGNSGIFYLARERCGNDSIPMEPIYKSSPEMQVLDNDRHPDAKLGKDGNRQAGSLYDLIPAVPQNAKPAGEWNKVLITVYKGTVIHNMNGENVLEYHLWTDDWKAMCADSKFADWDDFVNTASKGYIGLQDHGDDVWFRNIKIREL